MRARLEALIEEMLDGQILLDEAVAEFERVYIEKALSRHQKHLSKTAKILGIHRNTLSKRVAEYHRSSRAPKRATSRK
jgi:Fis family transcriptional regulator, factor for inversion stimulation protein